MKKAIIFFYIIIIIVFAGCKRLEDNLWGIWNAETVDINHAVLIALKSGEYYAGDFDWIGISLTGKGLIAGDINFPVFAVPGEYNKLVKYEATETGYLITLVGEGYKDDLETGKLYFKDDTQIQVKMMFIGENECQFEYISLTDQDGYTLSFIPRENVVYRRYKNVIQR